MRPRSQRRRRRRVAGADRDLAEGLVLRPSRLALLVELEQREERHGDGHAVGAAHRLVEGRSAAAQQPRRYASRSATVTRGIARWRRSTCGGVAQQPAERLAEPLGLVDRPSRVVQRRARAATRGSGASGSATPSSAVEPAGAGARRRAR